MKLLIKSTLILLLSFLSDAFSQSNSIKGNWYNCTTKSHDVFTRTTACRKFIISESEIKILFPGRVMESYRYKLLDNEIELVHKNGTLFKNKKLKLLFKKDNPKEIEIIDETAKRSFILSK